MDRVVLDEKMELLKCIYELTRVSLETNNLRLGTTNATNSILDKALLLQCKYLEILSEELKNG